MEGTDGLLPSQPLILKKSSSSPRHERVRVVGDDDAGGVHPGEEVPGKVADELGLDEHHVAVAEVPGKGFKKIINA